MKRAFGLLLIPSFLWAFDCTPMDQSLKQNSYTYRSKKNGIKLYTKKGAKYIEVAGEGIIDAPIKVVLAQLYDYKRQQKYMDRVKTTIRIKEGYAKNGDHFTYVYHRLKLPVVNDRDYVFKSTRSKLKSGYKIAFQAVPSTLFPPKSGVVRMTNHHGCWQIVPTKENKTIIRFELLTNPGGSLPNFLVERYTPDEIFSSFNSVKKMVKDAMKTEKIHIKRGKK